MPTPRAKQICSVNVVRPLELLLLKIEVTVTQPILFQTYTHVCPKTLLGLVKVKMLRKLCLRVQFWRNIVLKVHSRALSSLKKIEWIKKGKSHSYIKIVHNKGWVKICLYLVTNRMLTSKLTYVADLTKFENI